MIRLHYCSDCHTKYDKYCGHLCGETTIAKLESRIRELEAELVKLKRDGCYPYPSVRGFVIGSDVGHASTQAAKYIAEVFDD